MRPRRRSGDVHVSLADPGSEEVRRLLAERDAYFAALYPERNTTLLPVATLAGREVTFLIVRVGGELMGCGALIAQGRVGELKRFYVRPDARRLGLAARLLVAAERRAAQLGLWRLRLEVGRRQPAAIALYRRAGYRPIRCFSPYRPDAVCTFRGKVLRPAPRRRPAT